MELFYPTKRHIILAIILFALAGIVILVLFVPRMYTATQFVDEFKPKYILDILLLALNAYLLSYFVSLLFPPSVIFFPRVNIIQLPGAIIPVGANKYASKKTYNKLVRDGIPAYLASKQIPYKIHTADDAEYETKLFEKLDEEVEEFGKEKNVGELADILEILNAITTFKQFSSFEIEQTKQEKFEERGGFSKKIILEES